MQLLFQGIPFAASFSQMYIACISLLRSSYRGSGSVGAMGEAVPISLDLQRQHTDFVHTQFSQIKALYYEFPVVNRIVNCYCSFRLTFCMAARRTGERGSICSLFCIRERYTLYPIDVFTTENPTTPRVASLNKAL